MNANPIKALSNLFSKLVIEHGSAVIQEKHIALLKEQFLLLEKENTELKAQKQILATENRHLKADNEKLAIKIQTLEKLSSGHNNPLDNDKIKINEQTCQWIQTTGIWRHKTNNLYYCPHCAPNSSPLSTSDNAKSWFCPKCSNGFGEGEVFTIED